MKNKEHKEILTSLGLKKTESRVALMEVLAGSKKPLSAGNIFKHLEKSGADQVTIYRTLETLEKKGAIKRVHTGEREVKYEIADHKHDHHHVICLNCKKVSDFVGCDADRLIGKALKQVKDFKSVSHHSFDIFGICNACAK